MVVALLILICTVGCSGVGEMICLEIVGGDTTVILGWISGDVASFAERVLYFQRIVLAHVRRTICVFKKKTLLFFLPPTFLEHRLEHRPNANEHV